MAFVKPGQQPHLRLLGQLDRMLRRTSSPPPSPACRAAPQIDQDNSPCSVLDPAGQQPRRHVPAGRIAIGGQHRARPRQRQRPRRRRHARRGLARGHDGQHGGSPPRRQQDHRQVPGRGQLRHRGTPSAAGDPHIDHASPGWPDSSPRRRPPCRDPPADAVRHDAELPARRAAGRGADPLARAWPRSAPAARAQTAGRELALLHRQRHQLLTGREPAARADLGAGQQLTLHQPTCATRPTIWRPFRGGDRRQVGVAAHAGRRQVRRR